MYNVTVVLKSYYALSLSNFTLCVVPTSSTILPYREVCCRVEDVLHTRKKNMSDSGIPEVITFPSRISRLDSQRTSPEIFPILLSCIAAILIHHDSHHPGSTRIEYLTGRLANVKNLQGTTNLRVGHLSTLQYLYILREVATPRITTTTQHREEEKIVDLASIGQGFLRQRTP